MSFYPRGTMRLCALPVVLAIVMAAAHGQRDKGARGQSETVPASRPLTFRDYYVKAATVPTVEERVALALDVENSGLSYSEKAWLLYTICDPAKLDKNGKDAEAIAGAGKGFVPYSGSGPDYSQSVAYVTGVQVVYTNTHILLDKNASRNLWGVKLSLFRSSDVPDALGEIYEDPAPSMNSTGEMATFAATPPVAPGKDVTRDPTAAAQCEAFCSLYERACATATDTEKVALAREACAASISSDETCFILFRLLAPGMSADVAYQIAGAQKLKAVDTRWPLSEVVREDGRTAVRVGTVACPARWYQNFMLLTTEDKHPAVAEIRFFLLRRATTSGSSTSQGHAKK